MSFIECVYNGCFWEYPFVVMELQDQSVLNYYISTDMFKDYKDLVNFDSLE